MCCSGICKASTTAKNRQRVAPGCTVHFRTPHVSHWGTLRTSPLTACAGRWRVDLGTQTGLATAHGGHYDHYGECRRHCCPCGPPTTYCRCSRPRRYCIQPPTLYVLHGTIVWAVVQLGWLTARISVELGRAHSSADGGPAGAAAAGPLPSPVPTGRCRCRRRHRQPAPSAQHRRVNTRAGR